MPNSRSGKWSLEFKASSHQVQGQSDYMSLKTKKQNHQDGSADKSACTKSDNLSLITTAHMMEGENRTFLKRQEKEKRKK